MKLVPINHWDVADCHLSHFQTPIPSSPRNSNANSRNGNQLDGLSSHLANLLQRQSRQRLAARTWFGLRLWVLYSLMVEQDINLPGNSSTLGEHIPYTAKPNRQQRRKPSRSCPPFQSSVSPAIRTGENKIEKMINVAGAILTTIGVLLSCM